jgi:GAF domain-containing protein
MTDSAGDEELVAATADLPRPAPTDPIEAFAALGLLRLSENDPRQVLSRIAELAKVAIPGAAEVSVTLVSGTGAGTPAFTGAAAKAMDESQYGEGRGPCLDAAARPGSVVSMPRAATDTRYPLFAATAARAGVGSSLSVGIQVVPRLTGALNVYAHKTEAFGDEAVELAVTFANYAAVALANAHLYETTSALAGQMAEAMSSRAVIEQAKGVLMAQQGVDADEAFAILSRASQVSNRKLRDIAQGIVLGARREPGSP